MKYVFTEATEEAQNAADAIVELEYQDLLPVIERKDFKDTSEFKPRSFAKLQLRARNAVKELINNPYSKILMLCGSSRVNTIEIAHELVSELAGEEPTIAYAPTKFEFFGNDKVDGVLTSKGYVIMPCSHLLDHPKWLNMSDACIAQNDGLKLILCGDATECASLQMIWPSLDNVLRSDIVMEFPIAGGVELMSSLVASYVSKYRLQNFSQDAIELLCIWSSRQSGDRRWLGIPEIRLCTLVIAANRYAKGNTVDNLAVLKAIAAEDYRINYFAELELRNHRDNQILLATEGEEVGQINGLSVIETAGTSYEYGEPVRITATLRAGGEGDVIDIERKAELAGQIHAKAMMIINGFLSNEFGAEQPLPVSASLVFEQSYSEIDGDSASLTGLCAVISALSDLPIRQDLAVTGAVDQFGDVQPVGGVNEKIEGFFKICRLHGLTGTQGVIIPASCVDQLVLRSSVISAVKEGKFHIYVVSHVTGAAKLLLKTPWGDSSIENSICSKICTRLDEIGNGKNPRPWWKFF
ncbi:Lon protease (S16) C-terminal proteolytic domain-containing protein [Succinivibrio dextrinosolvens]|uniref:S16 family serine protease n=1 Tax=Succinivibrio dextrinosolvens TaxID=83771 RepID=UPI0008DFEFE7|nr:S16 family serine protease [Succinivibrio dextrinosolvens]SFS50965.1 Lon protease (S16) C-terminal proteolytic domain-containing protein [Succinivibrio dextrinosolvens]